MSLDKLSTGIMYFQAFIFISVVAILIALIVRRIKIRKTEDFERRDF